MTWRTPAGLFFVPMGRDLCSLQMGQHEPLPVPVQFVFTDSRGKLQPAARFARLQQKMNLRIMPKGFEMSYPLYSFLNRLFIYNVSGIKRNLYSKTLFYHAF